MVDWGFMATIALIFLASMLAAWLRFSRKDACLAAFHGFHVTLQLDDDRRIWGVIEVLPTGLEMHYRNAIQDDSHLETSYLLYENEFQKIQTIFRYADDLSPENAKIREKAIKQAFHPRLPHRFLRKTRIFISNASESLNEAIGLTIGKMRKPIGNYLGEPSETHLKQLGGEFLGQVGHKADPLLERLVGMKVVFEMAEDGVVHEHVGVFKNYSADFLEILNVQFPCQERIPISQKERRQSAGLDVRAMDDVISVQNNASTAVMLTKLTTPESEQLLDVVIDPGGKVTLYSEIDFVEATLHARIVRELDMIVPRKRAVIRHRAEVSPMKNLADIIFDVGIRLPWGQENQQLIAKIQEKLTRNPLDVGSIALLGRLMLEEKKFDEAEIWLRKAYTLRFSLPDNGRGVELHLQELARRRRRATYAPITTDPLSEMGFTIAVQDEADTPPT